MGTARVGNLSRPNCYDRLHPLVQGLFAEGPYVFHASPAAEDICVILDDDLDNGRGDDIAAIWLNHNAARRLIGEGVITEDDLLAMQPDVTAQALTLTGKTFQTSDGMKAYPIVILLVDAESEIATVDRDGNII
jgi:hypothetical protein